MINIIISDDSLTFLGEAIARALREYNPDILIDCHETPVDARIKFGGVVKMDAFLQHATVPNVATLQNGTSHYVLQLIRDAWDRNNLTSDWYYTTSLMNLTDNTVSMGGIGPDSLVNNAGLRNVLSFLVETRGIGLVKAHFKR